MADRKGKIRERIEAFRLAGEVTPAAARELDEMAASLEARLSRLAKLNADLDRRLQQAESSRTLQLVRRAGVAVATVRGRLGQWLLHSPFHGLYMQARGGDPRIEAYQNWLSRQSAPARQPVSDAPLISVLMPVHNPKREWLERAIASVSGQSYSNWELCIADDASSEPWVREALTQAASERRIQTVFADKPLGIGGAMNLAASLASGAYLGFLDHDDELAACALEAVAEAIAEGGYDVLYSDEDRLDEKGRRVEPIFRPDWSPELLLSCMYMGHLLVVRREIFQAAGGFRGECDGAQDFDLALRATALTDKVGHIRETLYHWRMHAGSTSAAVSAKPKTHQAGRRALTAALAQRKREATVEDGARANCYRLRPAAPGALASIVVCSRDGQLLERCLDGLARNTAYARREVIAVIHQTAAVNDPAAVAARYNCRMVPFQGEFNFARMNNLGARAAGGDVLVFLNDDVAPRGNCWLEMMVAQALREPVGAVGALLYYPSGAIQHAGIALGMMDGTGHPGRGTFGSSWWPWMELTREVSAVTGACMAVRAERFAAVGGFDERFPVNYNDVDLCLRLRSRGWSVILETGAQLTHSEGASRSQGVRAAERELFQELWGDWVDPYYHPALTRDREDAGLA